MLFKIIFKKFEFFSKSMFCLHQTKEKSVLLILRILWCVHTKRPNFLVDRFLTIINSFICTTSYINVTSHILMSVVSYFIDIM